MSGDMTFPCELFAFNPAGARLWHVLCECRGWRFYVGAAQTLGEAEAIARQYAKPGRNVFLSDKNDSTRIHGAWAELEAVEAAQ